MAYYILGSGWQEEDDKYFYTLGDLLDALRKHKDKFVRFIGTGFTIGELGSWRGSYDIPALTYETGSKFAADAVAEIEEALTKTHYGYKGGSYHYDEGEVFYVAPYGSSEEAAVVGYEIDGDEIILLTELNPY